jgi:hypothetical protein
MATHYELEGPGIEFRWRRYFPSRPASKPTEPSVKRVLSLFPGKLTPHNFLEPVGKRVGDTFPPPLCASIGMLWSLVESLAEYFWL